MSLYTVPQNALVERTAQKLKESSLVVPPVWAPFVKTATHKQRRPVNADWWYARSASVLRKVHLLGPIGRNKLKKKYSARKNMGMAPDKVKEGSGSIVREILQQLEKAGLAQQTQKGPHKGRVATPKGISLLDQAAKEVEKSAQVAQ